MTIEILGVDLVKTTCSIVGLDGAGTVVLRRRVRRYRLLSFLSGLSPCVVAMEACSGAHHVARFCQTLGHELRLMSPLYVRPYRLARARILAFQLLQPLGPIELEAPVRLAPPAVRHRRDPQASAYFIDRPTLPQGNVRLTQHPYELLWPVCLSSHG